MDFATVIVTLAGIGLIIFMLWFFLGKNGKPRAQREIAIFRTLRKWGALLLLAVLLVVVAKQTLLRPPTVKVVRVNRRDVVAEVQGTGTVTTNVLARVGSRITGTIQKLYVDERDFVQKGQIIAQIDDSDLRHQVDNAKAQLESARAAAERAQRDWEREKKLVARGVVSCQEADQYQERNLTSQRAVDAAAAELKYQAANLSYAQIASLVTGVVTKRWVDPGDAVIPGQPLFTIAGTDVIEVDAYVDQRFSGRIKPGQPALVMLRGTEHAPTRGKVFRVAPEADPAAEEMTVEVSFPLEPQNLEIGQWADVYIRVGEAKDSLAIPQTSIMPMGNDRFVFVVEQNNKLRMVRVEPTAMSPRMPMVAVNGDLSPGDLIVMMPTGLSAGQQVQPDKMSMAPMEPRMAELNP